MLQKVKAISHHISYFHHSSRGFELMFHAQVTRLIPDAKGTTCNQELEPVTHTKHSNILRVPFYTDKGMLRQWVSRFDIYPYLERFSQACSQSYLPFSI